MHARCAARGIDEVPAQADAALRGRCGDLVLGDADLVRSCARIRSVALCLVALAWTPYIRFFTDKTVAGWTSVVVVVLVLGGVQLLSLGIIGQYVGASSTRSRVVRCTSWRGSSTATSLRRR